MPQETPKMYGTEKITIMMINDDDDEYDVMMTI